MIINSEHTYLEFLNPHHFLLILIQNKKGSLLYLTLFKTVSLPSLPFYSLEFHFYRDSGVFPENSIELKKIIAARCSKRFNTYLLLQILSKNSKKHWNCVYNPA